MTNLQSVDSPMTTRMGGPFRPRFDSARSVSVVVEAEEPLPAGADDEIARALDEFDRADAGTAGRLIDTITAALHRNGADDFVVDVDGGMRHSGTTGLHVALRHPARHDLAIGIATLTEQALCAAAATDGDVIAVWVVADEAVTAGALCATLLVTPPRRLSRFFRFSYVRLFHDGRAEVSRNFPGALFAQS